MRPHNYVVVSNYNYIRTYKSHDESGADWGTSDERRVTSDE